MSQLQQDYFIDNSLALLLHFRIFPCLLFATYFPWLLLYSFLYTVTTTKDSYISFKRSDNTIRGGDNGTDDSKNVASTLLCSVANSKEYMAHKLLLLQNRFIINLKLFNNTFSSDYFSTFNHQEPPCADIPLFTQDKNIRKLWA